MHSLRQHRPSSVFAVLIGAALACQPLSVLQVRAAPPSPVVISEVNWAGSSISTADEWIELANVSEEMVDLSGWELRGGTGADPYVFASPTLLGPKETLLIANYSEENEKTTLNVPVSIVTPAISLSNSSLFLELADQEGNRLDVAGSPGAAPFAGHTATEGFFASMERLSLEEGDHPEAWGTGEVGQGFKDGSTPLGSPGVFDVQANSDVGQTEEVLPTDGAEIGIEEASSTSTQNEDPEVTETPEEPSHQEPEISTGCPPIDETEIPTEQPSNENNLPTQEPQNASVESIPEEASEVVAQEKQTPTSTPAEPSTTPSPTEQPATEESQAHDTPHPSLSELYPRPATGEAEWIEMACQDCLPGSLTGWVVEDASGKQTPLDDLIFSTDGFALVLNPGGKLNNDNETIYLKNPEGNVVEEVSYGTTDLRAPNSLEALAKTTSGSWQWTLTPTKKTTNAFPSAEEPQTPEVPVETSTSQPEELPETESMSETEPPLPETLSTSADSPISYQRTLRLSEIYAATNGKDAEDEYIEIENTSDKVISLVGWSVEDASKKRHTFTEGDVLENAFFLLGGTTSHITLNNDGDTIKLFAPDGTLIDEVTYPAQKKGQVYARIQNTWQASFLPTPEEANIYQAPVTSASQAKSSTSTSTKKSSTQSPSTASKEASSVSIEEALATKDETKVLLSGFTLIPPGVLGKTTFYIFDETGGIQVYFSKGEFPELSIGSGVRAVGILGTSQGERRLKIASANDITFTETSFTPTPKNFTLAEVPLASLGTFLSTSGRITKKQGDMLTIEQDGNELRLTQTRLSKKDGVSFAQGTLVTATGVLSKTSSGTRLLTTELHSLQETPDESTGAGTLDDTPSSPAPSNKARIGTGITIITLVTTTGLFMRSVFPRFKQWYAKRTHFGFRAASVH